MIYSVEEALSCTIIKLHPNRATAEIAREFKDFLFSTIEESNKLHIILEIGKVEFMDSFFLGAIVSGLKKIRNVGGDIRLADMQASLLPIFRLMHLDEVFQIFPDLEQAKNSFLGINNTKES